MAKLLKVLGAALCLYLLFFHAIGDLPLLDNDEPFYGQVAKEMARGAGWLTPHYDGKVFWDKPPLYYWLSGVTTSWFGANGTGARLPAAMAALFLTFIVGVWAAAEFGASVGLFGAVVFATCLHAVILSRAAVTDMVLACNLAGALYCYRQWLRAEGSAIYVWAAASGVMAGLALLTKGPLAFILLAVTLGLHLVTTGQWRKLANGGITGVGFSLIVGLPWFITMYVTHGDDFVQKFIIAANFGRFFSAEHPEFTGHWASYLMNFPTLLLFFFPWSFFLPQAMLHAWRRDDADARLPLIWLAVVFAFFSTSKTQLVTYIFPLYPAAALLVGRYWHDALSADDPPPGLRRGIVAIVAFSVFLGVGLAATASIKYPGAELVGLGLGVIGVVFSALALGRFESFVETRGTVGGSGMGPSAIIGDGASVSFPGRVLRRPMPSAFWALAFGMVPFAVYLMTVLLPKAVPFVSTDELARIVRGRYGHAHVVALKLGHRPSLLFNFDFQPEPTESIDTARACFEAKGATIVLCQDKFIGQIASNVVPIARQGKIVALGNVAAMSR